MHKQLIRQVLNKHGSINMTPPPKTLLDTAGGHVTQVSDTRTAKAAKTYAAKEQPRRRAVGRQITETKASIERDLVYIGNAIRNRKNDIAIRQMEHVLRKHARLMELVATGVAIQAAEAEAAIPEAPRPARTKTIVKPKRYKMWSRD